MNENAVIIPVELDTKSFDYQIKKTTKELETLEKAYKTTAKEKPYKGQKEDLEEIALNIEKVNNKLISMQEQEDKIAKKDLGNIQGDLSGIDDKISGITKKVGKWALAIFSVRSAYSFVRNAVSRISEQDEELKANIEYMRDVLAYSIEPIIRTIVDWAKQILQYIGYIIKAWTGKNIFENANKYLDKSNKSAKELKKTLMGFDEVNILGEQTTGGGITTPTMDLTRLDDIEPPKWVKWIAENKDLIQMFGVAIGSVLGAAAIGKILGNIATLFGVSGGIGLIGLSEMLLAIAAPILIVMAIKGVGDVIEAVKKVNEEVGNTLEAMDNVIKKSDETVQYVQENWDSLSPEQAEDFFRHINSEIQITKNQIEGLSEQKDSLWWNPWKQREIEGQIDEYQEHLRNLTQEKYRILIETNVNATQLGEFMAQISKSSLLNLPKNILSVANQLKSLTGISSFYGGGAGHSFAKGGIIYPRLAKGGLVNYPGRGIMYGGANIAERGTEAILPLTDSQQMQLLGKAIADNLNLNATIPVYVGNRQVAREMRKINLEDSFATNGG